MTDFFTWKKIIIYLMIFWIIAIVMSVVIINDNYKVLFLLIKMLTAMDIIGVSAILLYKSGFDKRELFYKIVLVSLLLFGTNHIINFVAHSLIQGLTAKYIGEFCLKIFVIMCVFVSILLVKKSTENICKLFIITGLLIGCSYMMVITPLSVPDELNHYQKSYSVSNYLLLQKDKNDISETHANYSDLCCHKNVSSAYHRFADKVFVSSEELAKKISVSGTERIPQYPIQYLPSAIGISIGRIAHLNFLGVFYLGRLCNLLFYLLCIYNTIKIVPKYKEGFFLMGLLPMSIHQAASLSSDAFIIGMSFLLIGFIIKIIINNEKITKKNFIPIIVITIFVAPAKVVYVFIAVIALLISKEQFGSMQKKALWLCALFGSGIIVVILVNYGGMASMASDHTAVNSWAGERYYSISDVVNNPIKIVKIYYNTILENGLWYFDVMIGSSLSGLSLKFPRWIYLTFEVLILMSWITKRKDDFVFSVPGRVVLMGTFAAICLLVMTSMLLGWTPISYDVIAGVHGRYFVPIMPLLFMSLKNNTFCTSKRIDEFLFTMMFIAQYFALSFCINYTF